MQYLLPCVAEAEAWSTCATTGLLTRIARRFNPLLRPAKNAVPAKIECIWFPYYFITFALESSKGAGDVTLSIEAWSGAFAVIELAAELVEGTPPGDSFPPKLSPAAAEKSGRNDLIATILRQRSRGTKPTPGATLRNELVYCPHWIYYYNRIAGRLDIRVVDGMTGERLGNRTRLGVLEALVAHHPT